LRLDVFLKVSRLVKRRTVAKEACDNGRIHVGGKPGKPGGEVKPGEHICLDYGPRKLTVEVLTVPDGPIPKALAATLYRIISDIRTGRDGAATDPAVLL
jgi:ribosomal 50S subunit-recycling heat shock protein